MKEYLIKPYARRVVDNAFGICASRFGIFRKPIIASDNTATSITKAIVALHNYLMHDREFGPKNDYCPEGFADGDWRKEHVETNGLQPLSKCWAS